MVNKTGGTKKIILSMLRNSGSVISGQHMSEKLGISRVAVWKHIKSLQELGYLISGSSTGYKLEKENDLLYSWEFDNNREQYLTYKNLTSTMERAREEVEKGCDAYTTIIAETQSAGKGQADRNWHSEKGGLYFTTILKPLLPAAYSYIYTFAASAALSETINELYHIKAQGKWPNDILVNGNKIAGILTESNIKGCRINWLNLGIGINVNNKTVLKGTGSIKEISGENQDRKVLLTTFEDKYRKIITELTPGEILRLWKSSNSTINKTISIKSAAGEIFNGTAMDVDGSGSLLIKQKNNKIKQALFGDIYIK